jgi:hypothetical protein
MTCGAISVYELPPSGNVDGYVGFVDPSGGSADSYTLAVSHREGERVVLDCVRERRPPFNPDDATAEFVAVLRSYRIREVTGDRYGGDWVRQAFGKHHIEYRCSEKPKSELYIDFLPLVNSGRVELLEVSRMATQLLALEWRTARGGRDTVDHAPGGHDDLANAAAGACALAAGEQGGGLFLLYKREFERLTARAGA